jgi:hypothetical protein
MMVRVGLRHGHPSYRTRRKGTYPFRGVDICPSPLMLGIQSLTVIGGGVAAAGDLSAARF